MRSTNRATRIEHLPILRRVANEKASALAFDQHLARLCYAIVALDPDSVDDYLRLGRALATLGDGDGMREVFQRAGRLRLSTADKKGVAAAYARAKHLLREPSSTGMTLATLRAGGWDEVDRAIVFARTSKPEKKCPKCDGWGYLQWFKEHDRGRCYECSGSGYVG